MNLIAVSLIISGVGITILFLALTFFYGMLSFISSSLQDRISLPEQPIAEEARPAGPNLALQAAAIAVAMARAEAERRAIPGRAAVEGESADSGPASPWWTLHHQRLLSHSPTQRRAL